MPTNYTGINTHMPTSIRLPSDVAKGWGAVTVRAMKDLADGAATKLATAPSVSVATLGAQYSNSTTSYTEILSLTLPLAPAAYLVGLFWNDAYTNAIGADVRVRFADTFASAGMTFPQGTFVLPYVAAWPTRFLTRWFVAIGAVGAKVFLEGKLQTDTPADTLIVAAGAQLQVITVG